MFGFFSNKIVGGDVYINNGVHDAKFRKERAEQRVFNLTAKLGRLQSREMNSAMRQEEHNTKVAIQAWTDALELAKLELKQEQRRGLTS